MVGYFGNNILVKVTGMSRLMVAPGSSGQSVSSRSGAVPPSANRLALAPDSEDYAYGFLLDMPVSGIRTHAKAYAKIMSTMGFGSYLSLILVVSRLGGSPTRGYGLLMDFYYVHPERRGPSHSSSVVTA